jgi:hypothetical protein
MSLDEQSSSAEVKAWFENWVKSQTSASMVLAMTTFEVSKALSELHDLNGFALGRDQRALAIALAQLQDDQTQAPGELCQAVALEPGHVYSNVCREAVFWLRFRENQERLVRIHESGHAVAAEALGVPFKCIKVAGVQGSVDLDHEFTGDDYATQVVILMSGFMAESMLLERSYQSRGCQYDVRCWRSLSVAGFDR